MINAITLFQEKAKSWSDDKLMLALKGQPIHDWRNWGRNPHRIFAEEAHRRGLIK